MRFQHAVVEVDLLCDVGDRARGVLLQQVENPAIQAIHQGSCAKGSVKIML